jgi:DNA polymerase-3 subunit gamma/tau
MPTYFPAPGGPGKHRRPAILARSLNCESGPTPEPCGTCSSCVEIAKGSSPDVIEIDGASNTSVNDVREIKDEVLYAPQSSRKKIYIIDEVHMLSNSAFNALLKTIEEPPPYIIFIFATTEVHKVPAHNPISLPAVPFPAFFAGIDPGQARRSRRRKEPEL